MWKKIVYCVLQYSGQPLQNNTQINNTPDECISVQFTKSLRICTEQTAIHSCLAPNQTDQHHRVQERFVFSSMKHSFTILGNATEI